MPRRGHARPLPRLRPLLLCAALLLAACGGGAAARHRAILYSPNGEPLSGGALGQPSCREAMARWFDRVDADRDGTIDHGEFIADARRQFAAMDRDKDGFVTPAELEAYRAPYRAGQEKEAKAEAEEEDERPRRPLFGGFGLDALTGRSREARDLAADRPDPVMSADVNLRFKVSLAEFLAQAERRFSSLAKAGGGRVTRAAALASCNEE